ncbi:MAG: hypothetical protein NXI04_16155 [Planctomycetaceae bacterium]|nr:hypothetical protein [Planctomycetaceae bacterium]
MQHSDASLEFWTREDDQAVFEMVVHRAADGIRSIEFRDVSLAEFSLRVLSDSAVDYLDPFTGRVMRLRWDS